MSGDERHAVQQMNEMADIFEKKPRHYLQTRHSDIGISPNYLDIELSCAKVFNVAKVHL